MLIGRRGVRDESVLYRLVALWSALGEWEDVVGALRGLGDLESDPVRRAKHVYAGAGIVRDKLRDLLGRASVKESLDIEDFSFHQGGASVLDFLDAERTYRATLLAYHQQLAAYLDALAQLQSASGIDITP